MDNQQVTQAELGWLAGFIDGEGYMGLRIHKYANGSRKLTSGKYPIIRPEFAICNTDKETINKVVDVAEKIDVNLYVRETNPAGIKRRVYTAQTKGINKCLRLLEPIKPHLIGGKRKRAELMIEFCKLRISAKSFHNLYGNGGTYKPYSDRELEIWEEIQPLMRRGRGTSETTRRMLRRHAENLAKIKEKSLTQ